MTNKQRSAALYTAAAVLLSIPFFAMLFTNEVKWSLLDFLIAAFLLFGTAGACDFVLRKINKKSTAWLVCALILIIVFLIWAELAVGIFGTPLAGS